MRKSDFFRVCLAVLGVGFAAPALAQDHADAADTRPILIELFSSQSCGACPTANQILIEMSENPQIFPIVWSVPYWEYMGETEPYAAANVLERQRDYADAFDLRGPYTPQVVVDGCTQNSGLSRENIEHRIHHVEMETDPGVRIQFTDGAFSVHTETTVPTSDIWLVNYLPGITVLTPERGGNAGTDLPHVHLATKLTHVGTWDGQSDLSMPVDCDGEACILIVQEVDSFEVLDFGVIPQATS
ncbi:DUF1223 domain-containing protein [Ponticaulis sp.]|uniref:DUF1223 domain-containing protein n=1 Tax=Ponticaulis sp. TaxID=2020902 RepID=UPI0025EACD7D|nr:DUF1223 domain-containing protein [Ponticaulis sp.]|tara:strand:+ start:12357 stop:13085 length:729 start_codon:yes stop_codon:yes gene_type:complete